MQQDSLINIEKKLDMVLKIMASTIIESKSFDDKIICLSNLGFVDNDIAGIMGVKAVTVRARKSNLKKKK